MSKDHKRAASLCRRSAVVVAALAVAVAPAVVVPTAAAAVGPTPAPEVSERSAVLRKAFGSGWRRGDDVAVATSGDASGFHVFAARQEEGWGWRGVATIQPDGYSEDDWLGYSCVTGDARYVVAVVAPRFYVNRPVLRDRGATAYAVSLADGKVRPLADNVAFKYHTPGCGTATRVVLTRHLGHDQAQSELLLVDAATGSTLRTTRVAGQVTSAVPVDDSVVGVMGPNVVAFGPASDGTPRQLVATPGGRPWSLRAAAGNRVELLAAQDGERVDVLGIGLAGGTPTREATGRLGRVKLYAGRGGHNVVLNADVVTAAGRGLRRATSPADAVPFGASTEGRAVLSHPDQEASRDWFAQQSAAAHTAAPGPGRAVLLSGASTGVQVPGGLPEVGAPAVHPPFRLAVLRAGVGGSGRMGSALPTFLPMANSTTPTCAVPRNHLQRQAPQPTAKQVDWAAQAAVRKLLTAANGNGRPANYANMGLAAYAPNDDFTIPALVGGSGEPIPRSVIEGIMAQESAWRHASRRALPGLAGNPNIGDYYGAAGTLSTINYDDADCGYGIAQVTTGMRASDTSPYSTNGKTKIAVDYAENIVAASKILANFWNQLANAGITLNGGDPRYLENWYAAIWAYNTGVQPNAANGNTTNCTPSPTCTDSAGNWGLGWTNNPANADYPPDRKPFLRLTYADAERPGDWAYQERVFGWMETPILDYKGQPSYAKPTYQQASQQINVPGIYTFCTLTDNNCESTYRSPAGSDLDYCRYDVEGPLYRHCWWHSPVTFVTHCPTQCALSNFTYATTDKEPAPTNPHPPACNSDRPANAVIVDNQPDPNYNVVGCGAKNWSSAGTFTMTTGSDSSGVNVGVIDLHQLGAGFGGHTWFTKNRAATDTAHRVTGTWTPPTSLSPGLYMIAAHVPSTGADTGSARYRITQADGTIRDVTINQHLHVNRWVGLGTSSLGSNVSVTLTNVTDDPNPGVHNVAFDALAFVPVSGTVVSKTVDAVSIFNERQDLDTDTPWLIDTPFRTNGTLYRWGVKFAGPGPFTLDYKGGTSYPPCTALTGTTNACIGPQTRAVFADWLNDILAAGENPSAYPPGKTIPRWLKFANDDPTPSMVASLGTAAAFADDESYKVRARAKVSYVVSNGQIVPGSASVQVQQRTGDTGLPTWMAGLFKSYQADYGITPPNLSYSAVDLNEYSHEATRVNANASGRFPGRAYKPYLSDASIVDGGSCLRVKTIGGGVIGYRPVLGQEAVGADVNRWAADARAKVDAGQAPPVVADFASEIYNAFFKGGLEGSVFNHAAPIWLQVAFRLCADASIRPESTLNSIVESSYMPDVYIYADGVGIGQNGTPDPRPVFTGEYKNFTHQPIQSELNPYDDCDIDYIRRAGNPWDIGFFETVDTRPSKVHYCDRADTFPDNWDGISS